VKNNQGAYGGAVFSLSPFSVLAVNCTIENNNATYNGGAIVLGENSQSLWVNITCSNNFAQGGNGGCFMAEDHAFLYLENSVVFGNMAIAGGAISVTGFTFVQSHNTQYR
jgi:hypothetical protein